MTHKIIDNLLDISTLSFIKNEIFASKKFPWYYTSDISGHREEKNGYFTHSFFKNCARTSNEFDLLWPIIEFIKVEALIRVKANMYPRTDTIVHHEKHVDQPFPHKGAIFYLNTNNGVSVIENEVEVQSIENRLLLFDSSLPHNSTTCTDAQFRANINFNFF